MTPRFFLGIKGYVFLDKVVHPEVWVMSTVQIIYLARIFLLPH